MVKQHKKVYVYELYWEETGQFYIGVAYDVRERIHRHASPANRDDPCRDCFDLLGWPRVEDLAEWDMSETNARARAEKLRQRLIYRVRNNPLCLNRKFYEKEQALLHSRGKVAGFAKEIAVRIFGRTGGRQPRPVQDG